METVTWKRILATTDFSPFANRAVRFAHSLAEQHKAELHVLHVVGSLTELAREHGATGEIDPTNEDANARWLATLLGESGGVRRVEAVRVGSDIPHAIVHYAKQNGIDLIVIATHGRTGLAHALLGSIAEKVIQTARCPILAIPRNA